MGDDKIIKKNVIKDNVLENGSLYLGCTFNGEDRYKRGNLAKLLYHSKELSESDPEYQRMLSELSDYFNPRAGRKIIGLEAKLKKGNRDDLLEDAVYLENKFARLVAQNQFSKKEEVIYFHCLSSINTLFSTYIKPLIIDKVSHQEIDVAIYDRIVKPLFEEIVEFDLSISMENIRGMLFFLTGKCHIKWSEK